MPSKTYSTNAGDCYGTSNGGFNNTATVLYLGNTSSLDYWVHTWIPFVLDLPQGLVIDSATLRLTPTVTNSDTLVKVTVGCEAADNPANPTSYGDLFGRALGVGTYVWTVPAVTANVAVDRVITTGVQTYLNRSGYAPGNRIGVMLNDNGLSTPNIVRTFAAYEHTTRTEPQLIITWTNRFIPHVLNII